MKKYLPIFLVFIFTVIFYLPIFINPGIQVNRGNDLTEFFWPIFYFVRESISKYHQLPFWNNLFFSGTPLLPDPQSPIFYFPNIIFLFFRNIDTGFIVSIFSHIFLAGLGMHFLARNGFKFSIKTSLFCSFVYIASPKLSGFIEAGHYGLIASWTWLPFVFLATIRLTELRTLKKSILLSITLAAVFFTHILIFLIVTISICILFIYLTLSKGKYIIKSLMFFLITGILTFGLIAITFLPQLSWQGETTRNLLLNSPDTYPKWLGFTEFIKAGISPILFGPKFIWNLDTEKTITLGFFTSLFAFFGFLKLKTKLKILFSIAMLLIVLISMNNISPI